MTIELSNGTIELVPEGADPIYFRRYAEAKLRGASKPRKATSRERQTPRKHINYAELVVKRELSREIKAPAGARTPAGK